MTVATLFACLFCNSAYAEQIPGTTERHNRPAVVSMAPQLSLEIWAFETPVNLEIKGKHMKWNCITLAGRGREAGGEGGTHALI